MGVSLRPTDGPAPETVVGPPTVGQVATGVPPQGRLAGKVVPTSRLAPRRRLRVPSRRLVAPVTGPHAQVLVEVLRGPLGVTSPAGRQGPGVEQTFQTATPPAGPPPRVRQTAPGKVLAVLASGPPRPLLERLGAYTQEPLVEGPRRVGPRL